MSFEPRTPIFMIIQCMFHIILWSFRDGTNCHIITSMQSKNVTDQDKKLTYYHN